MCRGLLFKVAGLPEGITQLHLGRFLLAACWGLIILIAYADVARAVWCACIQNDPDHCEPLLATIAARALERNQAQRLT